MLILKNFKLLKKKKMTGLSYKKALFKNIFLASSFLFYLEDSTRLVFGGTKFCFTCWSS